MKETVDKEMDRGSRWTLLQLFEIPHARCPYMFMAPRKRGSICLFFLKASTYVITLYTVHGKSDDSVLADVRVKGSWKAELGTSNSACTRYVV